MQYPKIRIKIGGCKHMYANVVSIILHHILPKPSYPMLSTLILLLSTKKVT